MIVLLRRLLVFVFFLMGLVAPVLAVEGGAGTGGQEYRVGVGDELNFRFTYVPEMNTAATVRSDGRVSLPLIGEVEAVGQSLAELTEQVEKQMSVHLRRPQLVINVQAGAVRRIFVGGEVTRPSMQQLAGPLTVLQAVMMAEGLRDTAQPAKTIVLRRARDGSASVLQVDLDAVMDGSDLSQDVPLQAYDVVIVPRSGIANLGRWVDQYIKKVLPFSMGFSYTITRNGVLIP